MIYQVTLTVTMRIPVYADDEDEAERNTDNIVKQIFSNDTEEYYLDHDILDIEEN